MGLQALHSKKKRFTVQNSDLMNKLMKMPHISSAFDIMNEKKMPKENVPKKENQKAPVVSNPL